MLADSGAPSPQGIFPAPQPWICFGALGQRQHPLLIFTDKTAPEFPITAQLAPLSLFPGKPPELEIQLTRDSRNDCFLSLHEIEFFVTFSLVVNQW